MKHVDKSGGFYTGRWGDAPIHVSLSSLEMIIEILRKSPCPSP